MLSSGVMTGSLSDVRVVVDLDFGMGAGFMSGSAMTSWKCVGSVASEIWRYFEFSKGRW